MELELSDIYKTTSFITFCADWPELLKKVLKVDEFNIVLDRNKSCLPWLTSPLTTDSPLSVGP